MEKKSLNFEFWRFCPDYDDLGLEQQWQFQDNQPYLEEKTRIAVPSCWDRKSAGELAEYQGIAWYWRVFSIPKSFEGKKYSLIVERMAHDVTVFVDGEEIGSFSGGFLPVEFDFSNISVGEDHFLAMRVDGREEAKRYLDPKIEEDDPLYAGA